MHTFVEKSKSCASFAAGLIVFTAAFLLLSSTGAFAEYLEREYKDMDADSDGSVNPDEFRFYDTGGSTFFNEIDSDSNGRIDFGEWITYRDRGYPFESRYRFKERGYVKPYKPYPRYRHRYYPYPNEPYPRFGLGFRFGHPRGYFHYDQFNRYGYDWHPYRQRFW